MNNLVPVIVTFIVFYFTYQIIALFARRKERMALIEKLGTCDPAANSSFMEQYMERLPKGGGSSLRTGCLLLGIGGGFIAGMFLTPAIIDSFSGLFANEWDLRSMITFAWVSSAVLFGGVGLLIAHIVESRSNKK